MKSKEYGIVANWNYVILSIIVLTVCTLLILYMPGVRDFDGMVLKSVQKFLSPYPSYIPLFFSEFGRDYNMFWPQFAACCALVSNQKYLKAFLLVFFVQTSYLLTMLIKNFVCRTRPCGDAYPGYSFPSCHAATEMTLLGICICLIMHYTRSAFWRYFLSVFLGIYIFMVCISRLWLGHHFPIDVIAGLFLGVLCVNLYVILCRFFNR